MSIAPGELQSNLVELGTEAEHEPLFDWGQAKGLAIELGFGIPSQVATDARTLFEIKKSGQSENALKAEATKKLGIMTPRNFNEAYRLLEALSDNEPAPEDLARPMGIVAITEVAPEAMVVMTEMVAEPDQTESDTAAADLNAQSTNGHKASPEPVRKAPAANNGHKPWIPGETYRAIQEKRRLAKATIAGNGNGSVLPDTRPSDSDMLGGLIIAAEDLPPNYLGTRTADRAKPEAQDAMPEPESVTHVIHVETEFGVVAGTDEHDPNSQSGSHPSREAYGRGDMNEWAQILGIEEGQEWRDRALCAQTDPDAFHPEKGGSTREAKRICLGCEVRAECLEYALANEERFGIWGGLSERERRKLRKRAS